MDKAAVVLQGAFLRADRLCHPSTLSSLQKAGWPAAGEPVLRAFGEVREVEEAANWTQRLVCALWLKLLSAEAEEDVESAWRESSLFPLLHGLPPVNSVVLFEFVRTTAAARTYTALLLLLPERWLCAELMRLIRHVQSEPTREEDMKFFLNVWRELWSGQSEEAQGVELIFRQEFDRLTSKLTGLSPQPAKKLKLEPQDSPEPGCDPGVLHHLLCALNDLKDRVSSSDLCAHALSISLDALYTTFLTERGVVLSAEEKLDRLGGFISASGAGKTGLLSPALVQEAQRHLRAAESPSPFPAGAMELDHALRVVGDLVESWMERQLLVTSDSSSCSSLSLFQLQQSVQRVMGALKRSASAASGDRLAGLLTSLTLPAPETRPDLHGQIITTVLGHNLEDQREFSTLFAAQPSQDGWTDCLEKNKTAFRHLDTVLALASTLRSRLREESPDDGECRKLLRIAVDSFCSLSPRDRNRALASGLRSSRAGLLGPSAPATLTAGFQQELHMAFNCITQSGAGATGAQSGGHLSTAVALVARVAFQSPESALRSCCHAAVFNKGAAPLMADILLQLPGLRGSTSEAAAGERDGLLSRCLQQALAKKTLSSSEREQLIQFVGKLMLERGVKKEDEEEEEEEQEFFMTPPELLKSLVLPNLSVTGSGPLPVDTDLALQLLDTALTVQVQEVDSAPHWVMDCSPFPLLYVLAQLHHQVLSCWDSSAPGAAPILSLDAKELLVSVLTRVGRAVGAEVAAAPGSWSRALFWLHDKLEGLDWTVRLLLKPVWGDHFKNEVPLSLLAVCDLPEQEWSGVDLPAYGPGTGLLAWLECCSLSDSLRSVMLSSLALDRRRAEHVSMFSKGLLVALTQALPWCSLPQWTRLLGVLRELIGSRRLSVPFSLEYVDFLPLLDLRRFSCELRESVLLLRVLQLLCGSSCSHWLTPEAWAHVGRLYAHAVRTTLGSLKDKLPVQSEAALAKAAAAASRAPPPPAAAGDEGHPTEGEGDSPAPAQEVLFVLSQLFCHVQHVQVMMPGGQSEPLFLCSLELLAHYEAVMAAFPESSSALESDDARHFFSTITDNLQSAEMKAVLRQKIAQLVSSTA